MAHQNCSIFQNIHECLYGNNNAVSIWKLYSIACWDDDKYQKASAKHEKIAHRFISLRLFFPPYLCPPFSHILCWINIILKSILPLHSSTEGKKSFANIYNILSHSQHNTILLSIFFSENANKFFSPLLVGVVVVICNTFWIL